MDGLLIVDKPTGPTSHDVVARARRLLREKRIGHTGTLDPLATGVLPLVVGRATRLARFLSASDKSYEAVIALGLMRKDGVPALKKALKDTSEDVRLNAVAMLGKLGGDAKDAVEAMAALLKDPSTGVRAQAAKALGEMGGEAKAALPALKEAEKDKEEIVRKAVEDAIDIINRKK